MAVHTIARHGLTRMSLKLDMTNDFAALNRKLLNRSTVKSV